MALLQLLRSVYGVKEHYLKPGLFQDDLDRFWLRRHASVQTLIERLEDVDTMLAEVVATTR